MNLHRLAGCALAALLSSATAVSADCDDIELTAMQNLKLGSFARPDAGSAVIAITPGGTRILPPELNIHEPAVDIFHPARFRITGDPGCDFNILITQINGQLSNATFQPASGYSLSTNVSGAEGELDTLGQFEFTMGINATVSANGAQSVGGSVIVTVNLQ